MMKNNFRKERIVNMNVEEDGCYGISKTDDAVLINS